MKDLLGMRTKADWETLYNQLGQLISEEPKLSTGNDRGSMEVLRWLGRVEVLIGEVSGLGDQVKFGSLRTAMLTATLTDAESQMRHIRGLLYTALAKAEINAPTAARGAFIPAGNSFDALTAVAGVLRDCTGAVLVVDPYMDVVALTDFLPMVRQGAHLRLLASSKQKNSGLLEAVMRWKAQYGEARPIELRLAAPRLLHDRLIMDDVNVWSLSQSFNAMAQRSPAMVQRVGPDIASAKRDAFTDMWQTATPT
jgi:hypothetical protein